MSNHVTADYKLMSTHVTSLLTTNLCQIMSLVCWLQTYVNSCHWSADYKLMSNHVTSLLTTNLYEIMQLVCWLQTYERVQACRISVTSLLTTNLWEGTSLRHLCHKSADYKRMSNHVTSLLTTNLWKGTRGVGGGRGGGVEEDICTSEHNCSFFTVQILQIFTENFDWYSVLFSEIKQCGLVLLEHVSLLDLIL